MDQTRSGLAQLRDLAAGIHPGILTDRGLGPAVDALASAPPGARLGDRIAALDGELTISSPPGRGTTLRAAVPLGAAEERIARRSPSAAAR